MNITIDGYNINYKITGPAGAETAESVGTAGITADPANVKTAVILQGWGTGMDLYDFVAGTINDGYRVVQFDLPGFGESDEPREPWRPGDYADFFCKFMEALGITETVLIGHSYGGRVIIKLAEREDLPFTISRIILIDSAGIMPERSAAQKRKVKRYKMMRNFLTSKPVHAMFPEVIDYWMSQQGSEDYRNSTPVMKKCLVMAVNEDQKEALPKIKQDTLLIWGDLDDATPIGDAKIMEEMIPNSGLVVLEGTGHYSFLEKPAQFRGIIRSYLDVEAEAAAHVQALPENAAEDVSDAAEDVSDGAEDVSDAAEDVSDAAEDVSDAAEDVSDAAEDVNESAEEIDDDAAAGIGGAR